MFQLNTGQTSGPARLDINVEPVWMQGYTGSGVVVGFVDDGTYAHCCVPTGEQVVLSEFVMHSTTYLYMVSKGCFILQTACQYVYGST